MSTATVDDFFEQKASLNILKGAYIIPNPTPNISEYRNAADCCANVSSIITHPI